MKLLLGTISALVFLSASASAIAQPGQPAQPAPGPPPEPLPPQPTPPAEPAPMPATGPAYEPATPQPAPLPVPVARGRQGFTAMLAIGYGLTTISPDQGDGQTESGLAGLNVELGTYLTPELAVLVTLGGTNFSVETGFGDLDFINAFAGVVAQYWLNPNLAVGGGAGLGIYALTNNDADVDPETGVAVTGRVNYRFAGQWGGMLSITPSFYDGATVTSTSFLATYQWD